MSGMLDLQRGPIGIEVGHGAVVINPYECRRRRSIEPGQVVEFGLESFAGRTLHERAITFCIGESPHPLKIDPDPEIDRYTELKRYYFRVSE